MEQIIVMKHYTGKHMLILGEIRIALSEKRAKLIINQYKLKASREDTMGSTYYE